MNITYNTDWNNYIKENHRTVYRMWEKGDCTSPECEFIQIPWSITMPNGHVMVGIRTLYCDDTDNGVKPVFPPKDSPSSDYIEFRDLDDITLAFVPHDQITEFNS